MQSTPRHRAFLDALATKTASNECESVAIAYRTLTLIDSWAAGAPADEIRAALARTLGTRLEGESGQSLVLAVHRVADALAKAGDFPSDRASIASALCELSRVLSHHTEYRLSLDVAHLAIEHACGSTAVAWQSHRVCACAHRLLSNLSEADAHYRTCTEIGNETGDEEAVFRGDHGSAMIACSRGNLPAAERAFRELVRRAAGLANPALLSRAQHELAVALGQRGLHAEALVHFEACLDHIEPEDRDTALGNIAYTHVALGNYGTARDTYLRLIDSSTNYRARITSRINLIQIYGALGQRDDVEDQKQFLVGRQLPTYCTADFWLTLGRAYIALDDPAAARPCLERAAAIGHLAGIGQIVIDADQALTELDGARPPMPDTLVSKARGACGEVEVEFRRGEALIEGSRA